MRREVSLVHCRRVLWGEVSSTPLLSQRLSWLTRNFLLYPVMDDDFSDTRKNVLLRVKIACSAASQSHTACPIRHPASRALGSARVDAADYSSA